MEEGFAWPCEPDVFIKTRKTYSAIRKFAKETLTEKGENGID